MWITKATESDSCEDALVNVDRIVVSRGNGDPRWWAEARLSSLGLIVDLDRALDALPSTDRAL